VFREVLLPALVPFLLFVATVVCWSRHPVPRPTFGGRRSPVSLRLIGHVGRTCAGGYAAFLLIVFAFEFGVARQPITDAMAGGLVLAIASGGAFLALSWLESLVRRRRW